jgi:hypothetical protein
VVLWFSGWWYCGLLWFVILLAVLLLSLLPLLLRCWCYGVLLVYECINLFCSLAQDLCAQNCALEAKAVVSKHLRQHCTLQAAILGLMFKGYFATCKFIVNYTKIFQLVSEYPHS